MGYRRRSYFTEKQKTEIWDNGPAPQDVAPKQHMNQESQYCATLSCLASRHADAVNNLMPNVNSSLHELRQARSPRRQAVI